MRRIEVPRATMEDMVPTVDLDLHVTLSFVETHKFLNEERDIYTTFVQQGGSRCFLNSTPVLTPAGWQPIDTLSRGDVVMSLSNDGRLEPRLVNGVHVNRKALWRWGVNGGEVTCSEDHRVLCPDGTYRPIKDAYGGSLAPLDSSAGAYVHAVNRLSRGTLLGTDNAYDLDVAGYHNYVVQTGPDRGLVVHNSGKTYGIAQALTLAWYEAGMRGEEQRISCVRDAMPALKATAMRDVIGIMQDWGMYDEKLHNKTDNILTLGRSEFEFFSLDNPQKVRGRGRDILWANEGNEISWEAFKQLNQRTTRQSIVDYNPSDEYSWIYDYLLGEKMEEPRADVKYLQTTYKDNPFLPDKIVKDIEWYQEVDPNAWRIYGLGERGFSGATIYPSFHVTKAWPESRKHRVFGLDFGFNNPSALVEVARPTEREMYFRQCIYEAKLTNTDLIKRLSEFVPPGAIIYADAAEPGRIEEIRRAGFNVRMADKRPHSVRLGIDFIKRHKIFVHESSTDLVAEFRGYKWRTTKDGEILDEPLKLKDHALDAARYAAATAWGRPKRWLAA